MRSRISTVLVLVFLVILVFLAYKGIKIGEFEVLSISQLIQKDEMLKEKIEQASDLSSEKYPQTIDELEETYEQYRVKKQKYEQLAGVTSNINSDIYETKQYDIGYLWRVLGKYATNRSLELGIDAKKTKNVYNFDFSVSGTYVNISQFITDIENDSDLYFRIYNFKMVPDSEAEPKGTIVTATFTVRNIGINSSTISK